ncbi:hypothetical protein SAMN02745883_01716 [Caminicella sporogenes DSM 14501]|uniref:Mur ligase middle domain-containing protein n=1 Tax=Caminicella sporogenes DSM 14501 TaxID=1121266 RepID=A0A1M6R6V9_9FIRM|nr:hypothetical protein [Caminicella sporogenes]RKD27324.1 hypothetical protein BET04_09320 [Caminicella sporogenes]SHK28192.1 hypothetical protein SAMN02745883_01716 [Caminicella sporogenes DSM 14501]
MSEPEVIGILGEYINTKFIADFSFYILENSGYNSVVLFDNLIYSKRNIIKRKTIEVKKILEFLTYLKDEIDILLFCLQDKDKVEFIIDKYRIDVLVDVSDTKKNNNHSDMNFIKKVFYENLSKNATVIINSDKKNEINIFKYLNEKIVITYGLNTKSTLTASSIHDEDSFICCLQRGLTSFSGKEIEPFEFPIRLFCSEKIDVYKILPIIALSLMYDVKIEDVQKLLSIYMKL